MHSLICLFVAYLLSDVGATTVFRSAESPGASGSPGAGACQQQILSSLSTQLPRELKLNDRVIEHARTSPRDARLLASLARIFAVLTPSKFNAMRHLFRVDPPANLTLPADLRDPQFFHDRPEFDSALVRDNVKILHAEFLRADLTAYDLVVLAALFSKTKRYEGISDFDDRDQGWQTVQRDRIVTALNNEASRDALARLVDVPSLRQSLGEYWSRRSYPGAKSRQLTAAHFDGIRDQVLKSWPVALDPIYTASVLVSLMSVASKEVQLWASQILPDQVGPAFGDGTQIRRRWFLPLLELHYGLGAFRNLPVSGLIELFDYVLFGIPLPSEAESAHGDAIAVAKTMLLPIKSAYQRSAPKAVPPIPPASATSQKTIVRAKAEVPPPLVSRKHARRTGTSEPLPTTDGPAAGVTYQVTFARNPEKGAQRVTFARDVVDQLNDPNARELRQEFLAALHQGFAWSRDQKGLRVARSKNRRRAGRVHEVELTNAVVLLMHVESTWQVLAVADSRAAANELVNHVEPLP